MELTRRHALAGAAAIAATPLLPSMSVRAAAPVAEKQAPSYYRYKVGDIQVTVVSDGRNTFPLEDSFITNAKKDEVNAALEKAFLPRDVFTIYFAPLVINTGGKLVVIDTGNGPVAKVNSKGAAGQFADNMAAAGFDPKAVDMVVISHFHGDHVNGLLAADGTPAFPNAEVLVPATEWKFWMDDGEMSRAPAGRMQGLFKNNRNIFDAGLKKKVTPYEWGKEVAPGLLAVDTIGHTPGHTSYVLSSGSGKVYIQSDVTNNPNCDQSRLARVLRPGRGYGGEDPPPGLRHGGCREAAGAGLPLSVPRARQRREGRRRLPGDSSTVESDDLTCTIIPGRARARTSDVQLHIGESRADNHWIPRCAIAHLRSGPSDHPGMTMDALTKTGRGLIAAPMINAATIFIVRRRRRATSVRADVCV